MFLFVYWFILDFFKAEIVLISPEYHFDSSYNVSMLQRSAPFLLHFPGAKWLKRGTDDLPSPSVEVKNAWNFIYLIFVVPCIMLNSEIIPTRCNNCVYSSQWLYSTCFG